MHFVNAPASISEHGPMQGEPDVFCCHPTTSMSLQGGSLVRPNKHMSSAGLHASIEVQPKQGQGQDMVAPRGASCRQPISHPLHRGIGRCDTKAGETGHLEGYRPARNHREVGLFGGTRKNTDMAICCFHKIKFLYGFICWTHLISTEQKYFLASLLALPHSLFFCQL